VDYRGIVSPDDVPAALAGATAGVSPLREDEFGALVFSMKVPEYIAAGLPVICSRTRTMRHYYDDGELFFFEPGDAEDLARAIREVLSDPTGARQRSVRGMSTLQQLDWSAQRKVLIETVDELVLDGHVRTSREVPAS
jgi:glycosyltransferase involved in cell wall biosynthesis